ncbi:MAG: hypothetical protein OJI67_08050 [Prosthecobacter sp.]|nr:hypothetical protein [Prosthecobacter sp.]
MILAQAIQQTAATATSTASEVFWNAIWGKVTISMISSSFTVLLMTFGKSMFDTRLKPFYLRHFRKNDQDVDGEWAALYDLDTGDQAVDKMILRQSGHIIEGTCEYTLTHNVTKMRETRQFTLKGELKNDYLVLYYTNKSRASKGLGTMTLQIVDDGKELKGYGVFYDTVLNKLDPQDYEYKRVPKA